MRWMVDSTQIEQFFVSTRRDAQELLPHLVRQLIFGTIDYGDLHSCRIPVGDEINRPGYDGVVEAGKGNAFVPMGLSVWEMSVGADLQAKADENYDKRSKRPGGLEAKNATFVFVTPHRWDGKDQWCRLRLEQGIWKDVRVVDNSDLGAWLETSPVIGRWFAAQVGVPVAGFKDLDLFFDEFRAVYGVRPSADLIIGGRDDARSELREWLVSGTREISVLGESTEEASIFIAASIHDLPEPLRNSIRAKTVFLQDPNALDYFSACQSGCFIVPLGADCTRRAKALAAARHRLLIPCMRSPGQPIGKAEVIPLGSIRRRKCRDALLSMGLPEQQADRISRESKGSLKALLWMLAQHWDETPEWTKGEAVLELVPLVLAGQWDASNENDRSVIEELASRPYGDIEKILARWTAPNGPLVYRGGTWDWLAWVYAWDRLAPQMKRDQIDKFCGVARKVLSARDPRFELPADERWAAAIYHKSHPYSAALRSGLVESVVELALHDSDLQAISGQSVADSLVHDLLIENGKPRIAVWLSLSERLQDLAEAAPDVFLEAAGRLCRDKANIGFFFENAGILSTSPHIYLLWALEALVWRADLLTRATLILGELAALDPGGQMSNRPSDSLTRIYLPWRPQTTADVQHQFTSLDMLYARFPGVAWDLAVSLLPAGHTFTHDTSAPKWRNWRPDEKIRVKYWAFIGNLIERMVTWAQRCARRWSALIGAYNELRRGCPELSRKLLETLCALNPKDFATEDRAMLSEVLRNLLSDHRELPQAGWAMKEDDLAPFDELYQRFAPSDLIEKHAWLFSYQVHLPDARGLSYEEREKLVADRCREVIQRIYGELGLSGLFSLAEHVERADRVGACAASLPLNDADVAEVLTHTLMLSPTPARIPPLLMMGLGFVSATYHEHGGSRISSLLSLDTVPWNANMYANLALGLPMGRPTWELLATYGTEAETLYWSRASGWSVEDVKRDTEEAAIRLLAVDRPYRAIDLIHMSLHAIRKERDASKGLVVSEDTILRVLKEAPQHDPAKDGGTNMLGYRVSELLDALEGAGVEPTVLAGLEWVWLRALEHTKRGVKSLQIALSTDPKWFIEALKLVYRAEDEEPGEVPADQKGMAEQACRMLDSWSRVPGVIEAGTGEKKAEGDIVFAEGHVDEVVLFSWVKKARQLAQECKRLSICDVRIGHVLAFSPLDADGDRWPCLTVRSLIEELDSRDLEHGIEVGVYNRRGVHGCGEGGNQERELAKKFRTYAQRTCSQWPRTSAMLDRIGAGYEHEGRWEDEHDAFREFE